MSEFIKLNDENNLQPDFGDLCAHLLIHAQQLAMVDGDFPLRNAVQMRSKIDNQFTYQEVTLESGVSEINLPAMTLGFLTLAGMDGRISPEVVERIVWNEQGEGELLHEFLDLLNRRFWELQFLMLKSVRNYQITDQNTAIEKMFEATLLGLSGLPDDECTTEFRPNENLGFLGSCMVADRGAGGVNIAVAARVLPPDFRVVISAFKRQRVPILESYTLRLGDNIGCSKTGHRMAIGNSIMLGAGSEVSIYVPKDKAEDLLGWHDLGTEESKASILDQFITAASLATGVGSLFLHFRVCLLATLQQSRLGDIACALGYGSALGCKVQHSIILQFSEDQWISSKRNFNQANTWLQKETSIHATKSTMGEALLC